MSVAPAGTVDTLLKPDMKKTLTGVLTYHVVPGKLDAKELMAKAKMGGEAANLKTVEGQVLTVSERGYGKVTEMDDFPRHGRAGLRRLNSQRHRVRHAARGELRDVRRRGRRENRGSARDQLPQ